MNEQTKEAQVIFNDDLNADNHSDDCPGCFSDVYRDRNNETDLSAALAVVVALTLIPGPRRTEQAGRQQECWLGFVCRGCKYV